MLSTNHIYHQTAKRRGDKNDFSMTLGELLNNITRLVNWNYQCKKKSLIMANRYPVVVMYCWSVDLIEKKSQVILKLKVLFSTLLVLDGIHSVFVVLMLFCN